jgi:hypothetical protein
MDNILKVLKIKTVCFCVSADGFHNIWPTFDAQETEFELHASAQI